MLPIKSMSRYQRLRSRKRLTGLPFLAGLLAFFTVYGMLNSSTNKFETQNDATDDLFYLRQLAGDGSEVCETQVCGHHCLQPFQTGTGGLILSIIVALYCFAGLAIICDEFFVASLEKISNGLKLSEDVAGATFMAAGSSAPELFVSMADNVFSMPQSVGVGTIIGSAIFNILIIIALTAILSGQTLLLDWRPLIRDSSWYCISIILLVIAVSDEYVQWYESLVMLLSYILYIAYMGFNEQIVKKFCGKKRKEDFNKESGTAEEALAIALGTAGDTTGPNHDEKTEVHSAVVGAAIELQSITVKADNISGATGANSEITTSNGNDNHSEDTDSSYFGDLKPPSRQDEDGKDKSIPYYAVAMLWYIFTLPLLTCMKLTVPDCRYKVFDNKFGIIGCFLMSILWIAILSHFLVEYSTIFGCIVGISPPVMGLTLIAAGTSVPDAMSSVIVARQGEGDMAVSNAIGSNVFDILLGLGLPYLLASTVAHPELLDPNGVPAINVKTSDLAVSIGILFGVVVAVVGMLILSSWKLYSTSGYVLVVLYTIFVVFSLVTGVGV